MRKVDPEKSLSQKFPHVAKQWHPTKNGTLASNDVTPHCNRKVWWICDRGHEWEARVGNRTKKNGNNCPYCSGRYASREYNLAVENPEIAKEWDYTKNGGLTPENVTPGSEKTVHWKCQKGHEWEAIIFSRVYGSGCPYCAGKEVCDDNSLETVNPQLAAEWHPTKNGDLTPSKVTEHSNKRVWWLCPRNHGYSQKVSNRAYGTGCPYCANKKTNDENCLAVLDPEIAAQWHPTKNGNRTPYDVTIRSDKEAWWLCENGHEWKAQIKKRTIRRNCPECNYWTQTSFCEQALYYYVKEAFPNAKNRFSLFMGDDEIESDIWVEEIGLAIEYDGGVHRYIIERDINKDNICEENNQPLVRFRLKGLPDLPPSKTFIITHDQGEHPQSIQSTDSLKYGLKQLRDFILFNFDVIDDSKQKMSKWDNVDIQNDRSIILDQYKSANFNNSIVYTHPEVLKEWHPTKNKGIDPKYYTYGSALRVWWKCKNGHEWQAPIANRCRLHSQCNRCVRSQRRAPDEKTLAYTHPEIASEWHPTKNSNLKPIDVTRTSTEKVWWQCEKGHEWQAVIWNRINRNEPCPKCKKMSSSLAVINPALAKEWHPTKNGSLTPYDVTKGLKLKVWWKCKNGHEWEARIDSRNRGAGCPDCSK